MDCYEVSKNKLYIITWTLESLNGGLEDRREVYVWGERQEALKRYLDLKHRWYAHNPQLHTASPVTLTEAEINQMMLF